jgi:hypothetical protein
VFQLVFIAAKGSGPPPAASLKTAKSLLDPVGVVKKARLFSLSLLLKPELNPCSA